MLLPKRVFAVFGKARITNPRQPVDFYLNNNFNPSEKLKP